jgi:hypothetical protein
MRQPVRILLVGLCFMACMESPAWAGVLDPVPMLRGTLKAQHIFSVPGVEVTAALNTVVVCTSTNSTPMTVAVEIYNYNGERSNDVTLGEGVLDIPVGRSVMFNLGPVDSPAFVSDVTFTPPNPVFGGVLRILATSPHLVCNALVTDNSSDPPVSMMNLPVIAKTKQKGE